jgi:BirA family biotin operon repressor/biotin-[acetyl-CoA-carboxylase] ligase
MSIDQQLQLIRDAHPDLAVDWLESVDSTQSRVGPDSLLISEQQTAGVGRRGNHWLTPTGRAICLSHRFTLPLSARHMSGYALVVGLAIIDTIRAFEPHGQAGLKWPNDLYATGRKFGGILINLNSTSQDQLEVTVGIGINWSLTREQLDSVNQSVCNIPIDALPERGAFISRLITQLQQHNQRFVRHGWPGFLTEWQAVDVLLEQLVRVVQDAEECTGLCQGVDEQGRLLVLIDGRMTHFSGGEVSVRAI